jgi:hypothetical protein
VWFVTNYTPVSKTFPHSSCAIPLPQFKNTFSELSSGKTFELSPKCNIYLTTLLRNEIHGALFERERASVFASYP